jgi:hypothetical protein
VTSEISATMAVTTISGSSRINSGPLSPDVCSAVNGDQRVSVPSEWKYQPCSTPLSPSARNRAIDASQIVRSVAGSAKADLIQRRTDNRITSVKIAVATLIVSGVLQGAVRPSSVMARPVVIRMPPASRKNPVADRKPPTTLEGTKRK